MPTTTPPNPLTLPRVPRAQRRDIMLRVLVSEIDADELDRRAADAGMTMSSYLRACGLGLYTAPPPRPEPPR